MADAPIERNREFILATSLSHTPTRYMLVYPISSEWLAENCGTRVDRTLSVQTWLDRTFNFGPAG